MAETGAANGNPPALLRLEDGRLCCVFGERNHRRPIARYSQDEASPWGDDQVLRADFTADRHDDPDLG